MRLVVSLASTGHRLEMTPRLPAYRKARASPVTPLPLYSRPFPVRQARWPTGPTTDAAGVDHPGREGVRVLTWGNPYPTA